MFQSVLHNCCTKDMSRRILALFDWTFKFPQINHSSLNKLVTQISWTITCLCNTNNTNYFREYTVSRAQIHSQTISRHFEVIYNNCKQNESNAIVQRLSTPYSTPKMISSLSLMRNPHFISDVSKINWLDDEAFGYLKRVIVTPAVDSRLVEFLHFDIQSTGQKSHCVCVESTTRVAMLGFK